MTPYIIGIAGPSGAGKTTLGDYLTRHYTGITHVRLDDFLRDPSTFPKVGVWQNWEHPQNIDFDALATALTDLHAGKTIQTPAGWNVSPSPVIILEGFLVFYDDRICQLLDLRVALTLPKELQLERRRQRQPDMQNHDDYFWEVVVPSFQKHGEPSLKHADVILSGERPTPELAKRVITLLPEDLQATISHNSGYEKDAHL